MSIGTTIKKLRRERDITQEQLAEYIGISSQAVSQWETDKTAPDISQLPLLAHIFDVSTDEILGVDLQKNEERIQAILDEAQVFYAKGEFGEAVKILEDGLRKFPRSYKIMANLAENYSNFGKFPESIDLCQKILSECTDSEVRYYTHQTIIFAYANSGDDNKAMEYAKELPHAWFSREDAFFFLLGGSDDEEREKASNNIREYISFITGRLMKCLYQLSFTALGYSEEDSIKLLKQVVTIGETIFCDGDYHFNAQFIEFAYRNMSLIYAEKHDVENTLHCLSRECEFIIHFLTYDDKEKKTSPAVRGYCDGGWIPSPDGNDANDMLKQIELDEESTVYDFIRDDPRFKTIIARLEKYAK